ncbi:MAG: pyruvate kinase [Planctomycetota bacterium]|nr:pyruvate kinase [Planctomycetota bacterium]
MGRTEQHTPRDSQRSMSLAEAITSLESLVARARALEVRWAPMLERVAPEHRAGAANLVHYVAFRERDLRREQDTLAAFGLSSLGRAEGHVLPTLRAVIEAGRRLLGGDAPAHGLADAVEASRRILSTNVARALGPGRGDVAGAGRVRIMVTMPSEAATEPALIRELVQAGMDVMRINCAHDDERAWGAMMAHLSQAGVALTLMDLGGPKLRTGPIEPGPMVLRLTPARDALGRVVTPARLRLVTGEVPTLAPADVAEGTPMVARAAEAFVCEARLGDVVRLRDARGSVRTLRVTRVDQAEIEIESRRTVYLTPSIVLSLMAARTTAPRATTTLSGIVARPGGLLLRAGDLLDVMRSLEPGLPASTARPARIGCTLPELFTCVKPGQPIWFDDGKVGTEVVTVGPEAVRVRVTHAPPEGAVLRADKGINVPETVLTTPALTEKDRRDLSFALDRADLVGLSFARTGADIEALQDALGARERPGIVLKVETVQAFENLPELLLTLMRTPTVGVMIARGDLAVEMGYERLAEVQEEILWMCEAARLPVIWATQVLERLAKKGQPTRAEVTDAAMGVRADAVMLNKGPYIVQAVRTLRDILNRMEAHQRKKTPTLRALSIARRFAGRA